MKNKQLGFRAMLRARQEKTKSIVSVGLDPLPEKLPACMNTGAPYSANLALDNAMWMIKIVDATAPYTLMYKAQSAHWEAIPNGASALQFVIAYIHQYHPDIPVFLDCSTQAMYKIAHLEIQQADGMNFSPYMGRDCMEFLVDKQGNLKALVSLCYTSNPASREMQDIICGTMEQKPYWEFVAENTLCWAEELGVVENAGLVMAAAYKKKGSEEIYSKHLSRCRKIVGDKLWFLVPEAGTQGGFVEETVKAGYAGPGSMAINSSSEIIFASSGEDFAEAAGEKARQLYLAGAKAMNVPSTELIPESRIVIGNPLQTLKNCEGYYKSRPDHQGSFVGPVVAYAGQYENEDGLMKNYVGFEYFNFAQAEQYLPVRKYFAKMIVQQIKKNDVQFDVVLGAPMGGILLADSVADELGCRVVFAEKKVVKPADPELGVKEISKLVIDRHEIRPGDKVLLIEDVTNNYSTTEKIQKLIQSHGGVLHRIACAFNRSGADNWKNVPVYSALAIPTQQFKQEDEAVMDFIIADEVVWKPKDEWNRLLEAMQSLPQLD